MLIAALDNNHFGDMYFAKELIAAASECGADLISMLAYEPRDIRAGCMPLEFYGQCAFDPFQCIELIEYARSIDNDLCFTILSRGFMDVRREQMWLKITGAYFSEHGLNDSDDSDTTIVSVPIRAFPLKYMPKNAELLFSGTYGAVDPELKYMELLRRVADRNIGYHDHTEGVEWAARAFGMGAHIIEKGFTLDRSRTWRKKEYIDLKYAAEPGQFRELSGIIHGEIQNNAKEMQ